MKSQRTLAPSVASLNDCNQTYQYVIHVHVYGITCITHSPINHPHNKNECIIVLLLFINPFTCTCMLFPL